MPRIEPPVSVRKRGARVQRLMRAGRKSCGWWVVLCATCAVWAQSQPHVQPAQRTARPEPAKTRLAPQLINPDDGLTILGAALAGRYKVQGRSDCSHLVHTVYEKAGFPYKYGSSSDLYAGIDEFRQVARPQPGDVVVWPGHAGIVVNPAQHTFYSALRSGFGVQPYDSIYWKGRGRPHFFRYVKAAPARAPVLSAANRTLAPSRTPSLKPAGLRNDSSAGPVPAVVVADATSPEDDPAAEAPAGQPAIPAIPTTVVIQAVRPKPEQVSDALWQQLRETGENLQSQDVFRLRAPLVACRRVQVQKLHVKGNTGWVDVRVLDPVVLSGARPAPKKRGPVQRWNLQRVEDGWELGLPEDTIYIPREAAARILAHQLADLTDSASATDRDRDQKVQLARWLSLLLDDPSAP
jgi:hypothetical protein